MQLQFIPVEEFYFALTLAMRTLEEIQQPGLVEQVRSRLQEKCGQPSTVAAAQQNTFTYVFWVQDYNSTPAERLTVSVGDWQDKLRLSSDYGWRLDENRKPVRTERFAQRSELAQALRQYLQDWLQVPLTPG